LTRIFASVPRGLVLFLTAAASAGAFAQSAVWDSTSGLYRAPAQADAATTAKPQGWQRALTAGANISFSSSQDVIGQTNGTSQTYGANVQGSLNHFRDADEWRNELSVKGATTKTPDVPRFVKSDDELKLSSIYLYFLPNHPKIGPYARAEGAAPIFKGEDVRSESKTYRLKHLSGTDTTQNGTSLRLTDGFKPLTTKEAVGFFYRPVESEKLHLETRLGFAGQQIQADGQYAVSGVNSAGEIEVNELSNVSQAGLEAAVAVKGAIDEKSSYEVSLASMTPFINNKKAGDSRDAWHLTNVDGSAKLTSKVTSWASFGYNYTLKIQPQLVERAQQIHMLVLSLNYPEKPGKL
jgi:hypothetical protein